jgi:hypothetical protein
LHEEMTVVMWFHLRVEKLIYCIYSNIRWKFFPDSSKKWGVVL